MGFADEPRASGEANGKEKSFSFLFPTKIEVGGSWCFSDSPTEVQDWNISGII